MAKKINCEKCNNGYYTYRCGKFGPFWGCSNYPNCHSAKKPYQFVLKYIEKYGVNIYCWKRKCYKCGKETRVYSYYIGHDLLSIDEYLGSHFGFIGLGDISYIDKICKNFIPTIKECYSKTLMESYIANTCEHCGALQGKFHTVDDPHELYNAIFEKDGLKPYLNRNIKISDISAITKDIKRLFYVDVDESHDIL